MTTQPEHLFRTDQLIVGDLWPQRWLRCHGQIVALEPYHGPISHTRAIARFADGQGVALDHEGVIPVAAEELAEWQDARRARGIDPQGGEPAMIITHELQVCTMCLHLIANGDYDDGTDAAARCAQGLVQRWDDLTAQIVPGLAAPCGCSPDEDCECANLGYHLSPCDGCGDDEPGDRFAVVILEPAGG